MHLFQRSGRFIFKCSRTILKNIWTLVFWNFISLHWFFYFIVFNGLQFPKKPNSNSIKKVRVHWRGCSILNFFFGTKRTIFSILERFLNSKKKIFWLLLISENLKKFLWMEISHESSILKNFYKSYKIFLRINH